MAIIAQKQIFGWNEIDGLGDLERLRLVVEYMPDEKLMRYLESGRKHGRDDYPVRAVWNAILAGVVFGHNSVESLRRELLRNAQLRQVCGFDVAKGDLSVPSRFAFTRFLRKLMMHQDLVDGIFDDLLDELAVELEGFGTRLACDGKAIRSHGRKRAKDAPSEVDGRRDIDADIGVKTYHNARKDCSVWRRTMKWFGYKLHLIVDSDYELPVAYELTKASIAEQPTAHHMLDELNERHPELLNKCEYFSADKGYDDGKLTRRLWDDYQIIPVIDIRDMWSGSDEPTRPLDGSFDLVQDYRGTISCCCRSTGELRQMPYGGFEADRETLKFLCPARHYGIDCPDTENCSVNHSIRVPLSQDRRRFGPLPRSSAKWQREYKKRNAAERVNSRLDVSFGFKRHFIRGKKKMKLRCSLALITMLAMALGRIRENQPENIRSLVRAA